ncbi:MAG: hypothetical protein ABIA47_01110 [bacterium]
MELRQVMQIGVRTVQKLDMQALQESAANALIRIWETAHHWSVNLGEEHGVVEFVLCDQKYLEAFMPGEMYGLYFGHMIFISTKTPERWIPFVALHEWAEYNISKEQKPGEDPSGLAKHWQALFGEIRAAGLTMTETEFGMYIQWRQSVERTRYFELDEDVKAYIARVRARGEARTQLTATGWTRKSIRSAAVSRLVGYGAAYDMGASHSDLLIIEIANSGHSASDIFAALSYFAYVDIGKIVPVPSEFSAVLHFLNAEVRRPVLDIIEEDKVNYLVRHRSGRTRKTVEAVMRRLARANAESMNELQPEQLPIKEATMPSTSLISTILFVTPSEAAVLERMCREGVDVREWNSLNDLVPLLKSINGVRHVKVDGVKRRMLNPDYMTYYRFRARNSADPRGIRAPENTTADSNQYIKDLAAIARMVKVKRYWNLERTEAAYLLGMFENGLTGKNPLGHVGKLLGKSGYLVTTGRTRKAVTAIDPEVAQTCLHRARKDYTQERTSVPLGDRFQDQDAWLDDLRKIVNEVADEEPAAPPVDPPSGDSKGSSDDRKEEHTEDLVKAIRCIAVSPPEARFVLGMHEGAQPKSVQKFRKLVDKLKYVGVLSRSGGIWKFSSSSAAYNLWRLRLPQHCNKRLLKVPDEDRLRARDAWLNDLRKIANTVVDEGATPPPPVPPVEDAEHDVPVPPDEDDAVGQIDPVQALVSCIESMKPIADCSDDELCDLVTMSEHVRDLAISLLDGANDERRSRKQARLAAIQSELASLEEKRRALQTELAALDTSDE